MPMAAMMRAGSELLLRRPVVRHPQRMIGDNSGRRGRLKSAEDETEDGGSGSLDRVDAEGNME